MTNHEIISSLSLLALLMELHEENEFKIKAIQSAITHLETHTTPIAGLTEAELEQINGLGKSTISKLSELLNTGKINELETLLSKTPKQLIELFQVKGLGAKKVKTLWKELNIESIDELMEACKSNKVATIKGFGEKTQATILEAIEFLKKYESFLRFDEAENLALDLVNHLKKMASVNDALIAGDLAMKAEIVSTIKILVSCVSVADLIDTLKQDETLLTNSNTTGMYCWRGFFKDFKIKLELLLYPNFIPASELYLHSASDAHLAQSTEQGKTIFQQLYQSNLIDNEAVTQNLQIPWIIPELRVGLYEFELYKNNPNFRALENSDLKGALHNHSTYSDGKNTIEEMAIKCMNLGLEYFGIADHSKSGNFYNGGMYEDKVIIQHKEIDLLNQKLYPFRIFKGIEVDILANGELDYDDQVMSSFEYVVASIHSNLTMDIDKASQRLIKAIEHPSTTILGHASGRLLLKRKGYPLDYTKVIDACAANGVSIEINANPMRLDLDWRYVYRALEKNIMICINPDAHDTDGLEDMKYGVNIARKAGLTADMTLNALHKDAIEKYFLKKRKLPI